MIEKKRKRPGTKSTANDASSTKPVDTHRTSLLRADEAFPRGGGSVLTPLEFKEATNEAKRDALFDEPTVQQTNRSKRTRSTTLSTGTTSRDGAKIEGLSYKRLNTGTVILGQITSINALDLVVALPNNLSGYVSITNVSQHLSSRLEAQDDSDSDSENPPQVGELPSLNDLFSTGQWVRCSVISVAHGNTSVKDGSKSKKRIDLSLDPRLVNQGLSLELIRNRSVIQACVKSIEDHGTLLDIGLEGATGFLKTKEYGSYTSETLIPGQVILCSVTSIQENSKVLQLSADLSKDPKRLKLKSITSVDAVLPGDGVEIVVSDAHRTSFNGKILGLLDATCDVFQAGALGSDRPEGFKAGEKVLGRVLYTDRQSDPRKVAVSLLPHVLDFASVSSSTLTHQNPLEAMPIGFTLDKITIQHVESSVGLFCELGVAGLLGFVHISRISDNKIESLSSSSGTYKVGTQHRARIVGFSAVDGLFLLSMEQTVLDTEYLNVHDLPIGKTITGICERFIQDGLLIKISDGITGLVPEAHIADVKLQFPEKKFKIGSTVKCRVLDTDTARRRVILTLKKSLLNSEDPIVKSFDVQIGSKATGIIAKLFDNGALVQFYGGVHAFLPVGEMSEAYISNAKEHFRIGQAVSVKILKVDAAEKKMTVSCKDSVAWDDAKLEEFDSITDGQILSATIAEKTQDRLVLSLIPTGITATLEIGHMSDSDFGKCDKLFQKSRVGGHLKEVIVIDQNNQQRQKVVSMKASLIRAAKSGSLSTTFESLRVGVKLDGFVRKAADYGILVGFVGGLTGLALKHNLSDKHISMPSSEFFPLQSISCTVVEVNQEHQRFQVTLKSQLQESVDKPPQAAVELSNAVDPKLQSSKQLASGGVFLARISSVKDTQLNIEFAEGIQGRVDVSSIFEDYDEIANKKRPLKAYEVGQEIRVKIVGVHDARNHKFLPISHKQSNVKSIFECTLRPSDIDSADSAPKTFQDVNEGQVYTAFVNNFAGNCLWVNISPVVRGRINLLDLDTKAKSASELQQIYSLGSAIRCRVVKLVLATKHLDLSERATSAQSIDSLQSVKVGATLPAIVTRVSESGLLAQLSDSISGKISLTDISSNYSDVPTKDFQKNALVQVVVKEVDVSNKKIALSLRSPTVAKVVDPEINSIQDLKEGNRYRGYIKNVADQGLFVELGRSVTARVRISEVSDAFIKDWKKGFSVDQLVSGTVIAVDRKSSRVEMSLKKNAKVKAAQSGLSDLAVGQVVEATVKKIEDFGIFIQVNSVAGVSGLCHKSEIADTPVKDISAIYGVGDLVKAKILDISLEKRRISFGLKSSYFNDADSLEDDEDTLMADGALGHDTNMQEDDQDDSEEEGEEQEDDDDDEEEEDDDEEEEEANESMSVEDATESDGGDIGEPLRADDFDWTGNSVFDNSIEDLQSKDVTAADLLTEKKKKKTKKDKKSYDDSGVDSASKEPSSVADFERLVLGQPDSSLVWINFMAYHMQLADFDAARAVADRALKTINYRQESEKLNVWMALLNLENNFGTPDSLEATFKKSLETNDPLDMYSRLVGTLIRSGKHTQAQETYDVMVRKFSQSTKVWLEYANFLADERTLNDIEAARQLLPRALQSLPKTEHISCMTKFAILEFKRGDAEHGRTLFEGLLSQFPKRLDLWNVLIDQEALQQPSNAHAVRALFERVLTTKLSMKKAKSVFKKWLQFEKSNPEATEDDVERVKAKAVDYVESH